MSQQTSSGKPELEVERILLVVRAATLADRVQQAIDTISGLDDEILVSVFGIEAEQLRQGHLYAMLRVASEDSDVTAAVDRCFANLIRTAASLRKRNSDSSADQTRTTLLIDDVQVLHGQLDFLQKFLKAPDLLSQLARSAYVEKYMQAGSREAAVQPLDVAPKADAASNGGSSHSHVAKTSAAKPTAAKPTANMPAAATPSVAKIPVSCTYCRQQFLAQPDLAGQRLGCPSCGQKLTVPSAALAIDFPVASDFGMDLPDLAAAEDDAGASPYPYQTRTAQPYPRRGFARSWDDEEIPRWVWYTMGGVLGISLLAFLAIAISAFISSMRG